MYKRNVTFGILMPNVKSITIKYKRQYISIFGIYTDKDFYTSKIEPSCDFNTGIDCLNKDCTVKKFRLYDIVKGLHTSRISNSKGIVKCGGCESHKHMNNMCPCTMEYEINIEYKQ